MIDYVTGDDISEWLRSLSHDYVLSMYLPSQTHMTKFRRNTLDGNAGAEPGHSQERQRRGRGEEEERRQEETETDRASRDDEFVRPDGEAYDPEIPF